jgi:hypothetical protein
LLLEQIADLFKLVNTVIRAVSNDVIHDIDEMLIKILARTMLSILKNVSERIKLFDLVRGITTCIPTMNVCLSRHFK